MLIFCHLPLPPLPPPPQNEPLKGPPRLGLTLLDIIGQLAHYAIRHVAHHIFIVLQGRY